MQIRIRRHSKLPDLAQPTDYKRLSASLAFFPKGVLC